MTHRQRRRGRSAFTLVELMVVITIIAILVALLAGAVMNAITKGPELQTSSEIRELEAKIGNVVKNPANPLVYVPSRLHLSKNNNYSSNKKSASYNPASPNFALDSDSMAYLQARFGKHTCFDFQSPPPQIINWNGDTSDTTGAQELYLEGEQCLVFHLGGIPVNASNPPPTNVTGVITMNGFSNNPQNPAAIQSPPPAGGERRQGPYFEFQSNRLLSVASSSTVFPANTGTFPVYLDPWTHTGGLGTRRPYAFFASYNVEGSGLYDKYVGSDCPSLLLSLPDSTTTALTPYTSLTGAWLNPSSFQIISAGKDGKFGAGGVLPRSGTTDVNGKDDQSNFSAHLLGVAP